MSPFPSGSPWPTYSDTAYKFTISYPPGFTFEPEHGLAGTGMLGGYRAVDSAYLNKTPPGQIEITIYAKDADTLDGWVTKHSGPPASSDMNRYWSPVTNQTNVTVAGRGGLSFDWVPDSGSPTIHTTAIFLGASNVLTVAWWSYDPTYANSLQQYEQRMLADLQG
jgi:hypothetical protein